MKHFRQNTVFATHAHRLAIGIMLMILLLPVSLNAATIQSLQSLRDSAKAFLQTQLGNDRSIRFQVGNLDPRLRLPLCKQALTGFLPANHRLLGHTTIGLRCNSGKGWKIHVPVQVQQFKNILVSNRNLPRGHRLGAADVTKKRMDISILNQGFYENTRQLSGLVLTRSILRGQHLAPGMLAKPRWVRRGQTITILAQTGQVAIRVKGKALMDGREGELVKIKNTSTNRELRGIVVAEGVVKVTL
ncbi:MAG: flagellar basal body P-ring formation chaperone FlgA [Thioalkalispiraceae bacterium]|jgi:flagella basal body P-ring formation protein FlgA